MNLLFISRWAAVLMLSLAGLLALPVSAAAALDRLEFI